MRTYLHLQVVREIFRAYCHTPGARREMKVPLAEIADAAEVGVWFTQINQIARIICAYLREIISVTCCERPLAEIADAAEAGASG